MFFSTTYEVTSKDQMALGDVELYSCQNNYFYFFYENRAQLTIHLSYNFKML